MITFVFNPLSLAARAAEVSFPGIDAEVQFVPGMESPSSIDYYADTGQPMIDINADISLDKTVQELLKVFAIVGSSSKTEEDEKFQDAHVKIQAGFTKLMLDSLSHYENIE